MTSQERDDLVRLHLPLVRIVARRVARMARGADSGDLAGDGCIGLIRAVDTFDHERGTVFETYARRVILGAMLNGLRRADPVSERVRRTLRAAEREWAARANATGASPSMAELERDDPALHRARTIAHRHVPLSIDAPLTLESGRLADSRDEPASVAHLRASRRAVAEAIALLPERERRILSLHYAGEVTLNAIGRELRVSPQRVSQLHLRAIDTLRTRLTPDGDYR